MAYARNLKPTLVTVITSVGVGCLALSVGSPLQAATVNSVVVTQVVEQNNRCEVFANISVTGTTDDDGNGNDRVAWRILNEFNGATATAINDQVQVGQTTTLNNSFAAIFVSSTDDTDKFFTVYDVSSAAQNPSTSDIAFQQALDRNAFIAAGGRCALAAPNDPPTADAGPDQSVIFGSTVTLDASSTFDADGDTFTLQWQQVAGNQVVLSGANSANPTFVPQAFNLGQSETYTFLLTATDSFGAATTDQVVVFASPPNTAPTVDAGPDQSVAGGDTVTLAGTASDLDNDPLTTTWVQTAGSTVTLSDPNALNPTFTAPLRARDDQLLTFELRADDGTVVSSDTVDITVAGNDAPVAVAVITPSSGAGNSTFTLNGSGTTDPEGDAIIYNWVQTGGPTGTIADASAAVTTFTAPAPSASGNQTLTFELFATDVFDETGADIANTTLLANQDPVAIITGDDEVQGGSNVTLDASDSTDPEGQTLTYQWSQVSGPAVTLNSTNSVQTSFQAPASTGSLQTLVFQVIATDPLGATSTQTFTLEVLANQLPTAEAGTDQTVAGGSSVTLNGTASIDPDGDALTYSWTQIAGPTVTLSDPSAAQPSFVAPAATGAAQTLVFDLVVSDGFGNSSPDQVAVTIEANRPPVADAGPAQGPINGGEVVTMDGSGSSDPDGDTLTYTWEQVAGTSVALSDANAVQPTFTAPNANETLAFRLIVSDGQASATSVVEIAVQAVGSITLVQRITGSDTQVSFNSDLAALTGSVATTNGVGQITAQNVPTGVYSVTAADLSAQGLAITDITCSDSDSTGNVAARSATIDLAAGEDVTCTFSAVNSREAAQVAIYNFLTGRNALLLANQPDLQRRIDRLSAAGMNRQGSLNAYGVPVPGAQHLPFEATVLPGQARFSSDLAMALGPDKDRSFDIWTEAYFGDVSIGSQDASFSVVHIGADLKVSDSLLIGAILQLDDFSDRDKLDAGEAEGDGFLAGPFITARLAPQLFVEARAAWGSSDNVVSPIDGQRDAFDTSRSLYSGSVVGQLELGKSTVLRPELTLRYLTEDQKGYTDSLGIVIPSQTVDQGDLSFRPRLSHAIGTKGGAILRPFAEVEGIYTFGTEPDAALANLIGGTFADTFGEFRARIAAGVDFMGKGNFRASLAGFYDGIGADRFSNQGVQIGVSFGF